MDNETPLEEFVRNLTPMPDEVLDSNDFINSNHQRIFVSAKEITWNNRCYKIGYDGIGYDGYVARGQLPSFLFAHKRGIDRAYDIHRDWHRVASTKTEIATAAAILDFDRIIEDLHERDDIISGEILDPDLPLEQRLKLYEIFGDRLKQLRNHRRGL